MTVQRTAEGLGDAWNVAYCVRCGWQSKTMSYRMAKQLACDWRSHACVAREKVTIELCQVPPGTFDKLCESEERIVTGRVEDIRASLRRLERELAELERFPEDTFAEGTIIRFEIWYTPHSTVAAVNHCGVSERFTYAALKAGNQWWVTGRHLPGEAEAGRGGIDYDTLRRILTRARNAQLFTGDGEPLEPNTTEVDGDR